MNTITSSCGNCMYCYNGQCSYGGQCYGSPQLRYVDGKWCWMPIGSFKGDGMSKCGKGCLPECEYFTTGGCVAPFNCMYKEEANILVAVQQNGTFICTDGYKQPELQQGWICPKCGAVMSPNQPYCINCTKFNTTISD